jgi:hypothetical protein
VEKLGMRLKQMNLKYDLIAEGDLYRLRAKKSFANVSAGDLGGLV